MPNFYGKTGSTGFDEETVDTSYLYLEEVVTLEFLTGLTGVTGDYFSGLSMPFITHATGNRGYYSSQNAWQHNYISQAHFPGYVLYKNRVLDESTSVGATGTVSSFFTSSQYGQILPTSHYLPNSTITEFIYTTFNQNSGYGTSYSRGLSGQTAGMTAACFLRNIDRYYEVWNPSTNWESGWGATNVTNKATQVRFSRFNEEYALMDFNITVNVKNPKLLRVPMQPLLESLDILQEELAASQLATMPGL